MKNIKLMVLSLAMILGLSSFSFAEGQKGDTASYEDHYVPGLQYAIEGRFIEAQEEFDKVLSPEHLIMKVLNDALGGVVHKEAAISIFRGYYSAWNNDWDQMAEAFNKGIELDPHYVVAYYCRGSLYYDLELYDKAIADYSKIIELTPGSALAYGERGGLYAYLGDYDKAIADIEKALELDPSALSSYQNLGSAYYFKKQYDKAIAVYHKLLEMEPRFLNAYYALAAAYDDKGDKESAMKYYKSFIDSAAEGQLEPLIKKAIERLDYLSKEKEVSSPGLNPGAL
jgi:tetratricopeptide (TPR) repeat protein